MVEKMKEMITERQNLFEPNVYVTMCVEIEGNVCPDRLAAAIQEAYNANEAAMSKIVLDRGNAGYVKLASSGCRITVTDKPWTELVTENERKPFALNRGELIRTFIITGDTDTQMMIMAHHLAGDGKSIIYLIKDIMSAYAGASLPYKPLTLLTEASFVRPLPLSAKLYIRYCRRKWKNRCFNWQDYYALHHKYWENTASQIRYQTLSADETKQIIEKSRQIGCSVNSYLVTGFLQRYGKKCEVGIPVSIRENENEAMSNLTSGISINYCYHTKKTFADNALQVHKKVYRKLRKKKMLPLQFIACLPKTLTDACLLQTHGCCSDRLARQTAKIMGYIGKTKRDLGISNLTTVDIPTVYGSCRIRNIIFVPPAVSYSRNIIGVSTLNGQMTISWHNMRGQDAALSPCFSTHCSLLLPLFQDK